jgi:hypothetical protein
MIDNWYTDPSGANARRYWRSGRWTNHVQGYNGDPSNDDLSPTQLQILPAPSATAGIPSDAPPGGVPYDRYQPPSSSQVRYGHLDPAVPLYNRRPVATGPVKTNACAVASMVMGIIGLLSPLLGLFGIIPLNLGKRARRQLAYGRETGDGFATAGIVMGWIQAAIGVFLLIFVLAALGNSGS